MEDLFDHLDDIVKKLFENLRLDREDLNDSYSISYSHSSNVDEPEIQVNGKTDPDISSQFKNLLKNFPQESGDSALNLESADPQNDDAELFMDIFEEENHVLVIIELPGIEKQNISLSTVSPTELELHAQTITKMIPLPYKCLCNSVKARFTNGILEINLEKDFNPKKTRIEVD